MDSIEEFWNKCCHEICISRGMNKDELDRGLDSGRWHLDIRMMFDSGGKVLGNTVSLGDGPPPYGSS